MLNRARATRDDGVFKQGIGRMLEAQAQLSNILRIAVPGLIKDGSEIMVQQMGQFAEDTEVGKYMSIVAQRALLDESSFSAPPGRGRPAASTSTPAFGGRAPTPPPPRLENLLKDQFVVSPLKARDSQVRRARDRIGNDSSESESEKQARRKKKANKPLFGAKPPPPPPFGDDQGGASGSLV